MSLPFERLPGRGRSLLGPPAQGDVTARHGYGPPVFGLLGHRCAYCGEDLSDYRGWLSISLDHVVPRQSIGQGWKVAWIEDKANLVPCCRACNEFTNQYRVAEAPPSTESEFFDARDRHFLAKRALNEAAHLREKAFHVTNVPPGASIGELLARYVEVLAALQAKGVIRGSKVVGDYAEALVTKALTLEPAPGGTRGFDATEPQTGRRIQIKARQVSPTYADTGMGPFRDLDKRLFDDLVGVVLEPDFAVRQALRVPIDIVRKRANHVAYDGTERLQLGPALLNESGVVDLTELLRQAATDW